MHSVLLPYHCAVDNLNSKQIEVIEISDENDYEYAAMAVTYNSVLDHCNFVNCTTNRHQVPLVEESEGHREV